MSLLLQPSRLAPLTLLAVLTATSAVRADGVHIEYRQEVMEAVGGHTGALKLLVTGKIDRPQDAKAHVLALDALARIVDPSLFPAGSGEGKTEALPAIWEKPAEFKKAISDFQTAVAALAQKADAAPAEMADAFSAMAKACKGCHDKFRKE
jgi:cytochrome c556